MFLRYIHVSTDYNCGHQVVKWHLHTALVNTEALWAGFWFVLSLWRLSAQSWA